MTEETAESSPPSRTLYVLIPPSPLFAAHWSFFIPDVLPYETTSRRHEESSHGCRIHVSGDRLNGFHLEIIRGYDIREHRSVGTRRFPIAIMSSNYLEATISDRQQTQKSQCRMKDEDEGGGYIDNCPINKFEEVCKDVEAPGPSLNQASKTAVDGGKRVKAEVKDCQWWIRQAVEELTRKGALEQLPARQNVDGAKSPKEIVADLPMH